MENVIKGKKIIIGIIILLLAIDIITIFNTSLHADNPLSELIQGGIRFILTCVILFFMYKGHKWAKWLISILLLLGWLMAAIGFLASFSLSMLAMGIIYISFGIALIVSKPIKDFASYQKGELHIENSDNYQ